MNGKTIAAIAGVGLILLSFYLYKLSEPGVPDNPRDCFTGVENCGYNETLKNISLPVAWVGAATIVCAIFYRAKPGGKR